MRILFPRAAYEIEMGIFHFECINANAGRKQAHPANMFAILHVVQISWLGAGGRFCSCNKRMPIHGELITVMGLKSISKLLPAFSGFEKNLQKKNGLEIITPLITSASCQIQYRPEDAV